MESNCKIWAWFRGVGFMMDGHINDECLTFVLVPGHDGRPPVPINACIFEHFTIYPGA